MPEDSDRPRRVGRYELVAPREEDIAGMLYEARDAETGRKVMVKLLARSVSQNPAFGRYVYDKWADRGSFEHPNVLHVLEAAKQGDLYYVAIEDVGGERLSARLTGAPLAWEEGLKIVRQMAEGLRAAHRRDVVHGHLKPSDVILTTDKMGRLLVKVVFFDLGVSPGETVVSIFGEVMGSPKYMAPEVIAGREPTPPADVFALGVIAYELLTGREPFPSEHPVGYLFANCERSPEPPDQVNEKLPREISLVVQRMLEKEPGRRYRSMQRVIDDLDRCVQSATTGHVEAVPYGTDSAFARDYRLPQPAGGPAARTRTTMGRAVAAVLLAVVVGVIGYVVGAGLPFRRTTEPPAPTVGPRPAPTGAATAPRPPGPTEGEPEPGGLAAQRAFEQAVADWQRYSRGNQFDLGVAAFATVARDHADTPFAQKGREEMARIYVEWARAEAGAGNLEAAVDHYRKAMETAPEGSGVGNVARRSAPGAMAALAESVRVAGDPDRAIAVYEQIAREFPGSKQAALLATRKPEILIGKAYVLWRDKGQLQTALGELLQIIKDYPGTQWARQARETLPEVYLDIVRRMVDEGRLDEAGGQLAELVKAYPNHRAAADAAEMDARILFLRCRDEQEAGRSQEGARLFGELLERYPASAWTGRAAWAVLGLERGERDMYDATTARSELRGAQAQHDAFDYTAAVATLEGVVRYARAGSPEAAEALGKVPQWLYESALHAYGRGSEQEWQTTLGEVSEQFPGTAWDVRSRAVLTRVAGPPDGMVYVPEGRFRMGTDRAEIVSLLRKHGPAALGADDEEVLMFAELAGLLSEVPRHVASSGAFYIDKTEVTNEQYKQFLGATRGAPPAHWAGDAYPAGVGDMPVAGISLSEAEAYAKWRGARLPTEAEWEKAARGVDGRRFPWGDVFDQDACRHMRPEGAGPVAVGSFPTWDSPYGCLDIIGNVREWTTSAAGAYPGGSWAAPEGMEADVVARGGAWFQEELVPIPARCASRYPVNSLQPDKATGFRCVVDVPVAAPEPSGVERASATEAGASP